MVIVCIHVYDRLGFEVAINNTGRLARSYVCLEIVGVVAPGNCN